MRLRPARLVYMEGSRTVKAAWLRPCLKKQTPTPCHPRLFFIYADLQLTNNILYLSLLPKRCTKQGQNQTDFHIKSRSFLEPQSEVPKACAPVPKAGDSPEDQEEGVVLGKKPAPGSPGSRTERAGGGAVKRIPEWNLWEGDACAEGRGSAGPARQERPGERSGNSGERRARKTGCPGGGSRAAARPRGWSPEPAPAGGSAERSRAKGQGGRRLRQREPPRT